MSKFESRKSDLPWLELGLSHQEVVEALAPLLTAERKQKISQVLSQRTRNIIPVVEGLYDIGNVNAVMRSAEALGLLEFHIIRLGQNFKVANRITNGADKWLDVCIWQDSLSCAEHLKKQGYQLVVTDLEGADDLDQIDFTQQVALVFGNEREGISAEIRGAADRRVRLPMVGFSQSYNISVAAALSFYQAFQQRKSHYGRQGDLSDHESEKLLALYYFRSVKQANEKLRSLVGPNQANF